MLFNPKRELADIVRRKTPARLNLGCGRDIKKGYINIDMVKSRGVDYIGSVEKLPLPDLSVDEIYARDVIEHFSHHQIESILCHWITKLKFGGRLYLMTPNLLTIAQMIVNNEAPANELVRKLYGGQDFPSNYHYSAFEPVGMKSLLEKHGMTVLEFNEHGEYNPQSKDRAHWTFKTNMSLWAEKKQP